MLGIQSQATEGTLLLRVNHVRLVDSDIWYALNEALTRFLDMATR